MDPHKILGIGLLRRIYLLLCDHDKLATAQMIFCLRHSITVEAISRLRVDLFEANKKIKSLEETILRDRSCIWEKQNSLQAQIDSLMPGSDTLGMQNIFSCE